MKKLLSFVYVLAIIMGSGELHGVQKKKGTSYFPSFSLPSAPKLSSQQNTPITLASDQKSSAQKKKQKNRIMILLANAGGAVVTAPIAACQSKMVQRLIKKTKNCGNRVLAIGPTTVRYASSEQGQNQIKSVLKSGLYYGIHYGVPVAGVIGGVKYLDMRNEKRIEQLRTDLNGSVVYIKDDIIQKAQGQSAVFLAAIQQSQQDDHTKVKGAMQNIRDDLSVLNCAVSGFHDKIDVTNNALTDAADNLGNLHSYLKDEKEAEVNTKIDSLEEARSYFAKNVNLEMDIQAILGSHNFKVNNSQRVIGKDGQYYRGVSVEVVEKTFDDPAAWVQRGNQTYKNTITGHKKTIKKAEEKYKNTCLNLWYRNEEGEAVSLYGSGKSEEGEE